MAKVCVFLSEGFERFVKKSRRRSAYGFDWNKS